MDSELLQRVMDLAERTGDRVIVVNPESGAAHAILPFDAYEELVDGGTASLRDLEDEDDQDLDLDELEELEDIMPDVLRSDEPVKAPSSTAPATDEEIEKMVEHDLEILRSAEQSQKEAGGVTPLDVLDDEANEEQYYLEPIE